ncbi:MAG TPA: hypothetical protein V6D46_01550 [Coleofasciculaceae cyanobacterium]
MPMVLAVVGVVALLLLLDWTIIGSLVGVIRGAIGLVGSSLPWIWAIGLVGFLVWCLSDD